MRVLHINSRSVGGDQLTSMLERTDPRLISLSHDKVYFLPERRLVHKDSAKKELAKYREENAQMTRS